MSSGYIDLPLSGGVTSLNDETGAITLVGGSGITIVPSGNNITINSSGVGAAVVSINGDMTAAQTLTVGTLGNDFAIVDNGSGNHQFDLPTASATKRGALSSADWSTFNGKQDAGNYITALTGDVTATGPGSVAATIANLAVTNAKIANATIDLTTKVTGTLPIANGGTGSTTTSQNFAFIGPTSGSGAPSFRALVSGDLPDLTQYLLLAGRAGGQTATGGTAASNNLVLRSTSNGTKGQVYLDETTDSSSTTTGALRVDGGAGIAKNVFIGGTLNSGDFATLELGVASYDGLGGTDSEAYGAGATTNGLGTSLSIGPRASNAAAAVGNCIAIGVDAATADNSIVIGNSASGLGDSLVIGAGATALGGSSVIFGSGAVGSFADVVIGRSASATGLGNNVLIGSSTVATGSSNVLIGVNGNDGGFASVRIIGTGTATASNQFIMGSTSSVFIGTPTQTGTVVAKTIQPSNRTGTNVPGGGNITLQSSLGTGTGARTSLIFNTPIIAASGTTPHTYGERLRLGETEAVFNNGGLAVDFRVASDNQANMLYVAGSTDRVGIATASPTARLHLPAGTATANTAPLKFTGGTLLTTPEAGAIEYDGVDFYATRTAARRKISLSDDSVTSSTTVANTTTETTIFTTTVGANGFKAGDVLRTNVAGYYSTANGSDTFTMRYKIGSTTILSIVSDAGNVTNAPFHAELITTIRSIGAGGTLIGHGTITSNNVGHDTSNTTTTSIDTTATMTFTVTIQWSAASASDTFTQTIGFDEFL